MKPTPEQQALSNALFLGDLLNRIGDVILTVVSRTGKRKVLSLTTREHARLKRLARKDHCTVSDLLRVAKVRKQQAARYRKRWLDLNRYVESQYVGGKRVR